MSDSLTQIQSICQHGIALAAAATPGPMETFCETGVRQKTGHRLVVAECNGESCTSVSPRANAKLFAAAPTLLPAALTALQEAVAALEQLTHGGVRGSDTLWEGQTFDEIAKESLAQIAASLTAAQTP